MALVLSEIKSCLGNWVSKQKVAIGDHNCSALLELSPLSSLRGGHRELLG